MKPYVIIATCTVRKCFTVVARSEQQAREKFDKLDTVDEQELSMSDWVAESIERDA